MCTICKQAETRPGVATVTLERGNLILVVKRVPARICPNCGEEYLDEKIVEQLLRIAEEAFQAGIQVDIREYAAA